MRSQNDSKSTDTIRYIQKPESSRAPPPYVGQQIPRVQPIRKVNNNKNSRPSSKRYDTFGENALETIYDQFKFLDESDEPSTSSQTPTSVNSSRPIMSVENKKYSNNNRSPRMIFYCVLPTIQLLSAVAILASSFLAGNEKMENKNGENSKLTSEAIHTLKFQNSLSTIFPSFFQILSSIYGYWPIVSKNYRIPSQILHIFFNSLVIVLWFNSICDMFFKISMEHTLQPSVMSDEKFVIDLIIGCIIYFATVILPAITLSITSSNLMRNNVGKMKKSFTAISFSLGTLLFSLVTTVIAVFTAQANLNAPKDLSDSSTMYAYGLKECTIFVFVVFSSIFSLIVTTQNNQPLILGSAIGQAISIIAISTELFTSDRISAIVNEVRTFESGSSIEIGIVLLNGCAIASLLLLIIQFSVFISPISRLLDIHPISIPSLIDNNRNPQERIRSVERTAF